VSCQPERSNNSDIDNCEEEDEEDEEMDRILDEARDSIMLLR